MPARQCRSVQRVLRAAFALGRILALRFSRPVARAIEMRARRTPPGALAVVGPDADGLQLRLVRRQPRRPRREAAQEAEDQKARDEAAQPCIASDAGFYRLAKLGDEQA